MSNNCECEQQQQRAQEEAIAAWEAQVNSDDASDAVERVLEAIRLGLDKERKSRFVRDCDYMRETQRHGLKNAWRVKICRWMFETGKAFDLSVDTIGCAIALMDQFLCVESVDKIMMQLLSLVCVFCASKMHDPEPLTLDELSLLCEARFSKQDMCSVEMHLLRIVNWELNPPNAFTFARDFVHALALPDADAVEASVTDLLKAVAEDYRSVRCKASSIALAAVQLTVSPSKRAPASVPSSSSHESLAAFTLVQRVYASMCASERSQSNNSEVECDVSCSPVAVESCAAISVAEDIASLQQLVMAQAAPCATQRTLFASPVASHDAVDVSGRSIATTSSSVLKKRERAASMSLAH